MAIIAISAGKGGVGKSYGTMSLAAELGAFGSPSLPPSRVLVVDLDASRNSTLRMLDQEVYDGLVGTVADVFAHRNFDPSSAVYPASSEFTGVSVMAGSPAMDRVDKLLADRRGVDRILARALDGLRSTYPTIIIDCPPTRGTAVSAALAACDAYLMPFSLDQNAIEGCQAVQALIADLVADGVLDKAPLCLGAYASCVDKVGSIGTKSVLKTASEMLGESLLEIRIPASSHVREAIERGTTLQAHRTHPVSLAYQELTAYIMKTLTNKRT